MTNSFDSLLPTATLLITFMLLCAFGGWLILRGIRHCCKLHAIKGCCQACIGASLSSLGLLVIAVIVNIASYGRLTYEQPVAELTFTELAPQKYQASVTFLQDQRQQEFLLDGDEWQLDAKVLKWQGYANLIGFNAHYKLHRLAGRYTTIEQSNNQPATNYDLNADPGLDIWQLIRQHPNLLPLVDAYYGSAVFLPMADQAHYKVFMTQSGLIARPINPYSQQQLRSW